MSYHEKSSKKRKTGHNAPPDTTSFKPSAQFTPSAGGRDWTVSVAVPTSILTSLITADQRMTQPGRIARALAVFSVDEVVIYDDTPPAQRPRRPADHAAYTGDTDPSHFLYHVLSYLECPPFMRKTLFPLHPNLRAAGQLPSLDMPHHPHPKEWISYREGATTAQPTSTGKGTLVDCGLDEPVEIEEEIPPKTRITLRFPDDQNAHPEPVHPDTPRTEGGFYWGYQVRRAGGLSSVFTESPYEDGYDVSIGTSERGCTVPEAFPSLGGSSSKNSKGVDFKHMLVVFGGPRGIEFAAMNDEELSGMEVQGAKTKELFDHWVNVLPNQGSRTIRTDEALFIALTALRGLWES